MGDNTMDPLFFNCLTLFTIRIKKKERFKRPIISVRHTTKFSKIGILSFLKNRKLFLLWEIKEQQKPEKQDRIMVFKRHKSFHTLSVHDYTQLINQTIVIKFCLEIHANVLPKVMQHVQWHLIRSKLCSFKMDRQIDR